jgi:hypothetical protein
MLPMAHPTVDGGCIATTGGSPLFYIFHKQSLLPMNSGSSPARLLNRPGMISASIIHLITDDVPILASQEVYSCKKEEDG